MQLTQLKRTANQREARQSSWVELRRRRYRHFADATQLNSTRRRVELCRYKRALSSIFASTHGRYDLATAGVLYGEMIATYRPSAGHSPGQIPLHSSPSWTIFLPT